MVVFLVLGAAWWLRARPADGDLPTLAVLLLAAAVTGSLLQALLRLEIGFRTDPRGPRLLGEAGCNGEAGHLVLTPIGYRSGARAGRPLAAGDGNLWVASAPPLALLGAALALGVVLGGFDMRRWFAGGAPEMVGRWELSAIARVASWVWLVQGTAMLLPIPGSAGRQVLWGVVEGIFARRAPAGSGATRGGNSALRVGRWVDQIQGMLAVLLAAVALWLWQRETVDVGVPVWPFLLALSILVWSGRGVPAERASTSPIAGRWSPGRVEREKAAVRGLSWWKRLRIRRTQRAERGEAVDARRLDEVLARLHRDGFESLSAADRMLLRRVSQRLRQSREQSR